MSTQAHIMAAGPFRPVIKDCLEYSAECYDQTETGRIVFSELFYCSTKSQTVVLCEILGIEAWNFNTHRVDLKKLLSDKSVVDSLAEHGFYESDINHAKRLAEQSGWVFYFRLDA